MRYIEWSTVPDTHADSHSITRLLKEYTNGDHRAKEQLFELVYPELKRIAAYRLKGETSPHLLQPTALISEAWVRLQDQADKQWENRRHFFAVSAEIMRRILIDDARRRKAQKREGALTALPLRDNLAVKACDADQILALDEALRNLAAFDERLAQIVELRYFGGLSPEEIGEQLSISARHVRRQLRIAEAWLHGEIQGGLP
jgi:RNA polymerase sigma factor (TIGR02999 family)